MKILYISQIVDKGGATIALLNIVKQISINNEVAVFLPAKKGWLVDELKKFGCVLFYSAYEMTFYPIACIFSCGKYNPIGYLRFIKGMYNKISKTFQAKRDLKLAIKTFKPDIVHCNCGPLDICQKSNIPHIWHLREYLSMDKYTHVMPSLSC